MNRRLRQPGADLYQYQKLILSAEETASGYGWGFSPADFLYGEKLLLSGSKNRGNLPEKRE